MKAISDTLIHFLGRADKDDHVKQLEIFKDIIEKGLKTSTIDIVFSSGGTIWGKGVCFTDMPLNFCDEQTAVYGKFGIGFKKSFVKRLGGNPARYKEIVQEKKETVQGKRYYRTVRKLL